MSNGTGTLLSEPFLGEPFREPSTLQCVFRETCSGKPFPGNLRNPFPGNLSDGFHAERYTNAKLCILCAHQHIMRNELVKAARPLMEPAAPASHAPETPLARRVAGRVAGLRNEVAMAQAASFFFVRNDWILC